MRFAVIFDRQGASRANQDLKFANAFQSLLQNNFPERLGQCCVLEPNWVFKILYAAMKMFLSKASLEKIKMLGKLDELKEWYDESQLNPEHGGIASFKFDPVEQFGLAPK